MDSSSSGLSGTRQIIAIFLEEWKWIIILTIVFFLYFHYTKTFDFFEKKAVKFMKPTILLGNLGPRIISRMSFHDFQLYIYNYFKGHPYGGIFEGRRPVLFLLDSDLIKAVTIRDFEHFVDRNSFNSNQPKYLSESLINLKGGKWKEIRSIITPSFSSARLKHMFSLVDVCSQQLVEFLKKYDGKDVEMKDTMGHFTLEVIGACAFGIKSDALTDNNAYFVKVAEKFNFMPKSKRFFIYIILIFMPELLKYLNISVLHFETTQELVRMLKATKAERRQSAIKKNDFLQLMIDAAEVDKYNEDKRKLDDDTIDAQALLFLIAGYETSSTLLSFAIHVLATRPDIQTKLREHIEQKTAERDMSYDLVAELTYLEAFLLETLRMYPPVSRIDRVCTKPYVLPGTSVKVNVKDVVAIPVYGIHMDPKYYPKPHEFRPERFLGEEKAERPSHQFLAFGSGPRNCIGLRFAMFTAKMAMAAMIKNFKFSTCAKTEDPIKFDRSAFLLKASTGLWVHVEKL